MRKRDLVPAADLTTFKIGGLAKIVYEPENLESLISLLKTLPEYFIIGNGSNVVFSDKGIDKSIIHLSGKFNNWGFIREGETILGLDNLNQNDPKTDVVYILAFSACSLMRLSSTMTNLNYSGLEFAAGIPGTIGGAVAMNAGAHGHEISEIIDNVYVIDRNCDLKVLNCKDINFQYRKSNIEGIIIGASLVLRRSEDAIEKRKSCLEYRKKTQPLTLPSAGSVFINIKSNDKTLYAAELIQNVGLKGYKIGGVQFSDLHSNWLVKCSEDAKTENLLELISLAKIKVKEKYGIELQTEIKFWE